MFRENNPQGQVPMKKFFFILMLAAFILLLGVASTFAWLRYERTLQTAAMVQVFDLSVVGPTDNSLAMNLGEIDSANDQNPRSYVFGVKSNVTNYWIQLGYTTNNSFTFSIYEATKSENVSTGTDIVTEEGVSFRKGSQLTNPVVFGQKHSETYKKSDGTYDYVQGSAEPVYQQYGPIPTEMGQTQYYILEVSWSGSLVDKETDMVYLTVGTNGIGSN